VPERKDKWHECKQIPVPKTPTPRAPKKLKKNKPLLISYPCILMILSFVMLPMHTVAMLLKLLGMSWIDREETFYAILHVPLDCYKALKLYWWPPPEKAKRHRLTRKKLLLMALSIAATRATHAAPEIEFRSQERFKRVIKKYSRNGMLLTARLSTEGA
jgi:hypothetical protein